MHTLRSASLPFSPSFYTIICGRYSSPRWPTPARSLGRANGFDVTHEHGNESALDACIPLGFRDDIRRKGRAFLFSVPLTAQSKSPASLPTLSPPSHLPKTNCHPYCHVQGPNRKSNHIRKKYSTAHDGQHCEFQQFGILFSYDVTPTGLSAPFGTLFLTTSPASTTAVLSLPSAPPRGRGEERFAKERRGSSRHLSGWDCTRRFLFRRRSFHVSCPTAVAPLVLDVKPRTAPHSDFSLSRKRLGKGPTKLPPTQELGKSQTDV